MLVPRQVGMSEAKSIIKLHQRPAAHVGELPSLAVKHCCVPVGSGLHFPCVTAGLSSKERLKVGTKIQPRHHLTLFTNMQLRNYNQRYDVLRIGSEKQAKNKWHFIILFL